jgi:MFS family permease
MAINQREPSRFSPGQIRLHGWLAPPVIGVGFMVLAAGFGQFGAVAALGDVAEQLGEVRDGETIAEQAGLSGTALGIGLAIIRLASLFALPLSGLADRLGRRRLLLWFCVLGLVATATASLSPTYWWFVALFAVSRPFLTATDTVGAVVAAEQTGSADRAKALALIAAAFGIGAGLVAIIRGIGADALGFRGVFALALVPLLIVPFAVRRVAEPDRYRIAEVAEEKPLPILGAIGPQFRRRLAVLVGISFAVAAVTGPANSFIFLYGERILGLTPAVLAVAVVAGGPAGLAGLLMGRWGSDHVGRRPTAALGLVLIASAGILTYSGSVAAALGGYLAAITVGSVFIVGMTALAAELFPTEVRAAVAGWTVSAGVLGAVAGLAVFGTIADRADEFGVAAAVVFIPAALMAVLLVLIPETRGRELEDWARD